MADYWHWTEDDRWFERFTAEWDAEAEHVEAVELAHRERLDEKGLPHRSYDRNREEAA